MLSSTPRLMRATISGLFVALASIAAPAMAVTGQNVTIQASIEETKGGGGNLVLAIEAHDTDVDVVQVELATYGDMAIASDSVIQGFPLRVGVANRIPVTLEAQETKTGATVVGSVGVRVVEPGSGAVLAYAMVHARGSGNLMEMISPATFADETEARTERQRTLCAGARCRPRSTRSEPRDGARRE